MPHEIQMSKYPAKRSQHIATLLAQHLQSPAKRSQHFSKHIATLLGATCCVRLATLLRCDMLGIENRSSVHALVEHCCTNLAKRPQHHATSTNAA